MSKSILIVDDQNDILDLLKEALEQEGYAVTTLPYTEDIVTSVTLHQPDLVMLDFLLAGINGGELCHQVKTHPLTSHIPVIMLSGYPRVLESLGLEHLISSVKQLLDTAEMHT